MFLHSPCVFDMLLIKLAWIELNLYYKDLVLRWTIPFSVHQNALIHFRTKKRDHDASLTLQGVMFLIEILQKKTGAHRQRVIFIVGYMSTNNANFDATDSSNHVLKTRFL